MSSSFGDRLRVSVFGQSHSQAVGAVVDGLPAGERVDLPAVQTFLARRAPGRSSLSTARRETDEARVLSGLVDGVTCGAPLCAVIDNQDARPDDYRTLADIPRPSHADYTAHVRYGGFADGRGGGHFSGRLTAPLCFAGAVCAQILARRGILVAARAHSVAGYPDAPVDMLDPDMAALRAAALLEVPALSPEAAERMREAIARARAAGDSVGGVVECFATGLPAGLGDPMFDGVESRLSAALFAIPGVRGVEFGAGFAAAAMTGSGHNDGFVMREGSVRTATNRHGGALGGITSGMPLVVRAACKPTPSISLPQRSVNLRTGDDAEICVPGRHDPCIVPRAVPCVEAAVAVVLLDLLLCDRGGRP